MLKDQCELVKTMYFNLFLNQLGTPDLSNEEHLQKLEIDKSAVFYYLIGRFIRLVPAPLLRPVSSLSL